MTQVMVNGTTESIYVPVSQEADMSTFILFDTLKQKLYLSWCVRDDCVTLETVHGWVSWLSAASTNWGLFF